jgi:hypothetical protein
MLGRGNADQARERGRQVLNLAELSTLGHEGLQSSSDPYAKAGRSAYCPDGQAPRTRCKRPRRKILKISFLTIGYAAGGDLLAPPFESRRNI